MWYKDGRSKKQIKTDILSFLKTYAPDLSLPRWENAIDKQIKLLDKYPLIEIGEIGITQKEIDTILKLKSHLHWRLAFTLLCIAKFKNTVNSKNNSWASCNDKEIFRMANIQKNIIEQSKLFRELRDAGLVQYSKIVDNLNVQVLFIDAEGAPVRFVDDFRNLGNQILAIGKEPYFKCHKCGLWVRQNKKGNRKYCRTCENYLSIEKRYMFCADCGREFLVDSKANNRIRCDECFKTERSRINKEYYTKIKTDQFGN
jgi:DNA-directed RNA polymerase subunit RPC12/RpoP